MEKFSPAKNVSQRGLVMVALACGDQITARNPPLHNKTTYICPANRGHGYKVAWKRCTSSDHTRHNPLHEEEV